MSYRVTAPLVITKGETGSDLYLYQGAIVPEFVKADELKRLKADELIEDDGAAKSAPKSSAK